MKKKTKMKKRPSNFLDLIVNWSGITMSQKNGPLSMFLIGYFGTFNLYFEFFDKKKLGHPIITKIFLLPQSIPLSPALRIFQLS